MKSRCVHPNIPVRGLRGVRVPLSTIDHVIFIYHFKFYWMDKINNMNILMHTTLLQHTDGGKAQVTHILRRTQAKSPLDWFWIKMNRKKNSGKNNNKYRNRRAMRAEAQFHCGRQLRALPTNRQATFVCTAAYTPQPAVLLLACDFVFSSVFR